MSSRPFNVSGPGLCNYRTRLFGWMANGAPFFSFHLVVLWLTLASLYVSYQPMDSISAGWAVAGMWLQPLNLSGLSFAPHSNLSSRSVGSPSLTLSLSLSLSMLSMSPRYVARTAGLRHASCSVCYCGYLHLTLLMAPLSFSNDSSVWDVAVAACILSCIPAVCLCSGGRVDGQTLTQTTAACCGARRHGWVRWKASYFQSYGS